MNDGRLFYSLRNVQLILFNWILMLILNIFYCG